jgi:hypothetical protein
VAPLHDLVVARRGLRQRAHPRRGRLDHDLCPPPRLHVRADRGAQLRHPGAAAAAPRGVARR